MKVTEKNAAMIMGRINKFFEKDTKIYNGIGKRIIGTQSYHHISGRTIQIPIYEDYKRYDPFIGRCNIHWIREKLENKIKNNETLTDNEEYDYHNILLAIEDKYSLICIPIYAGFDVKITGNSLIIKENDTYSKVFRVGSSYPKIIKFKDKTTYEYFYHMPISEEEAKEGIRNGIKFLFELGDESYCIDDYEIDSDENELHSVLQNHIYDLITKIDLDAEFASLRIDITQNCLYNSIDNDIFVHIDIENIKKNGIYYKDNDLFYYTYKDEKFTNLYSLIAKIINK